MLWNHLLIPKHQRISNFTLYDECNYLSMLWLSKTMLVKRGLSSELKTYFLFHMHFPFIVGIFRRSGHNIIYTHTHIYILRQRIVLNISDIAEDQHTNFHISLSFLYRCQTSFSRTMSIFAKYPHKNQTTRQKAPFYGVLFIAGQMDIGTIGHVPLDSLCH